MPVRYVRGDVTRDDADILVNTVNCVSVMGKGVALAFRTRWPVIMDDYRTACASRRLTAGGCLLFSLPDGGCWAAMATKSHWREPSRYPWVQRGIETLAFLASEVGARSIAIPPPGCGNGGLDWQRIHPRVTDALSQFDLRIYGSPP